MLKIEQYRKLVQDRKECKDLNECKKCALINPSQVDGGIYDVYNHISPWATWQGNLDTDVVIIGECFGGIKQLKAHCGLVEPDKSDQ